MCLVHDLKFNPEDPKKFERHFILSLYRTMYLFCRAGKVLECSRRKSTMRDELSSNSNSVKDNQWIYVIASTGHVRTIASAWHFGLRTTNSLWHSVTKCRKAFIHSSVLPALQIKYMVLYKDNIKCLSNFFESSGWNLRSWTRHIYQDHWFITLATL